MRHLPKCVITYSQRLNTLIYLVLSLCVSTQYDSRMPTSHGKYDKGNGVRPMAQPNGVNGMQMPIAIMAHVISITGHEAALCTNGILRVRVMCTINVCESNPSTNQPDWNKASVSGP